MATEVSLVIWDPEGRGSEFWTAVVEREDAEVVEDNVEEVD